MENNKLPTRQELKTYFETDKYPTQSQFANFIDAYWHKDDNIPKEKIEGLENLSLNYALQWSPTDRKLSLSDSKGVLVSEISLQTLDDEGTDLRYNPETASLELYNVDNKLLDSIAVSDFVKNVGTQLTLNFNTLQLKDSRGNVLSGLTFAVSNIGGLQSVLDNKVEKTVNINTAYPLQGGGNLSADKSLSILQANTNTAGYLSSADWNTFNNKFDKPALNTNYLGRWNGAAFANSMLQDNGTSLGIGSNNYGGVIWSVDSTTKAALIAPRMTQSQRLAIALGTSQTGAMVYQTDGSAGYYLWNGGSWQSLGGANIATADLTNTQARVFTQNANFTWDTSGNPYYLKGLTDTGNNLKDYPKVLKLNPTTKQVVEGDALIVSIPDTLPNPATPTSQTLNIVHTYTNSPTALDTNVKELNDFIMNIGNLEFTNLTVNDWNLVNASKNTAATLTAAGGVSLKCSDVTAFANGEVMACAYPNLVLPADKSWVFIIGGSVGSQLSNYNVPVIGITESSAKSNVGLLNGFLSSYSVGWWYNSVNFIPMAQDSTPVEQRINISASATCIFTKVGNILNITVRAGNETKTFNTDVTGVNSFKPLCSLIRSYWNDNINNCVTGFGKYWIEP
ncbi:hypothetical protein QE422_001818 [Chryseobacterium sp. SORGH_AS 447]|uniref:hypothetical protein n=1 Tax=Chryseobacterium sp. SORGH_AS_0447 TaxID=3041769 RepID=UPI002788CAF0|nr:hypothetical protein [Chryseobacterium sp. SORGH_AS_0447]MDQ1161450.1 hypothetical protein [Chryseobacterium sp. SORGH_AS_0447]